MAVVAVQTCESFTNYGDGSFSCASVVWQQAYLIPPEAAGYVDILVSGGFSPEGFAIGMGGTLTVFCTGLALGWIASLLRKAK